MNNLSPAPASSSLRQRLVEDMTVRGFSEKTRRCYIRIVAGFAAVLGRSPDTATAEDVRRFQVHQSERGMHAPAMNSTVAALRFFFTITLDRPELSRKLIRIACLRKLPVVLSPEEVARLLGATTCLKHRAALGVAYGAGGAGRRGGVAQGGRHRQRAHADPPATTSSSGGRCRHPCHPGAARARQARQHRALYPGGHADGARRHQPARQACIADGAEARTRRLTRGALAAGGGGHLPSSRSGLARRPCRPSEPGPAQGDVRHRDLPHGRPRRPC